MSNRMQLSVPLMVKLGKLKESDEKHQEFILGNYM